MAPFESCSEDVDVSDFYIESAICKMFLKGSRRGQPGIWNMLSLFVPCALSKREQGNRRTNVHKNLKGVDSTYFLLQSQEKQFSGS